MQSLTYTDGTPSVTRTYDLAGSLTRVEDGTGSHTFAYDSLGRLAAETNALAVIARGYDELGRDAGFDLGIPGCPAASVRYSYDATDNYSIFGF